MRYRILFLLLFFVISAQKSAAQAQIEFLETEFHFNEITEGTLATHTFEFINTGDAPLVLNKVRASCGCTTPFWTKDPINPGEKGVIKVSYNSKNRPGRFNKSITIQANTTKATHVLYIKGNVVREQNTAQANTPETFARSPKLVLSEVQLEAGQIQLGQKIPLRLEIKNTGKSPLKIDHISTACNCVRIDQFPVPAIEQGETLKLPLLYEPNLEGRRLETVFLYTNDLTKPKVSFKIQSEVKENLAGQNMLKEKKSAFDF